MIRPISTQPILDTLASILKVHICSYFIWLKLHTHTHTFSAHQLWFQTWGYIHKLNKPCPFPQATWSLEFKVSELGRAELRDQKSRLWSHVLNPQLSLHECSGSTPSGIHRLEETVERQQPCLRGTAPQWVEPRALRSQSPWTMFLPQPQRQGQSAYGPCPPRVRVQRLKGKDWKMPVLFHLRPSMNCLCVQHRTEMALSPVDLPWLLGTSWQLYPGPMAYTYPAPLRFGYRRLQSKSSVFALTFAKHWLLANSLKPNYSLLCQHSWLLFVCSVPSDSHEWDTRLLSVSIPPGTEMLLWLKYRQRHLLSCPSTLPRAFEVRLPHSSLHPFAARPGSLLA